MFPSLLSVQKQSEEDETCRFALLIQRFLFVGLLLHRNGTSINLSKQGFWKLELTSVLEKKTGISMQCI